MTSTLSVAESSRFSPKQLGAAWCDLSFHGFFLEQLAIIVQNQMLIPVKSTTPSLAKAARDSQKNIREQASFYCNPMKGQIIKAHAETQEAMSAFTQFSESAQTIYYYDASLIARQTLAGEINQLSQRYNHFYMTARELSEESVRLSHTASIEAMSLSRQLDLHCSHLITTRENAIAIMTAIDLLDETIYQSIEQWLHASISNKQELTPFKLHQERISHRFYCYFIHTDSFNTIDSPLASAISRNCAQRTQLYYELSKINVTIQPLQINLDFSQIYATLI